MKDEEIAVTKITIKIGKRVLELSVEQARNLYEELGRLFNHTVIWYAGTWSCPSITYPQITYTSGNSTEINL